MRIHAAEQTHPSRGEGQSTPRGIIALRVYEPGLRSVDRRAQELGLSRSAYIRHIVQLDCNADV